MGVPNAFTHVRSLLTAALLLGLVADPVAAEVVFGDLHTAEQDTLVFTAETAAPSVGSHRTGFFADADTRELTQLTAYPEQLTLLPDSSTVRIQNRFGVFQLNPQTGLLQPQAAFPAFVFGDEVRSGKVPIAADSPDGDFMTYLRPRSTGFAELILLEIASGEKTRLAERVPMSLDTPPVSWSPEGDTLVYSTGRRLYYYSLEQHERGRISDREMRYIGNGSIHSVQWGRSGDLFYVSGNQVYQIRPNELFTRALYQQVMSIGRLAGKLPFKFDPNFDRFVISPDGEKLLFTKSERNVFLLYLNGDDFLSTGEIISLPYLYLPRSARIEQVVWSIDDIVTVAAGVVQEGIARRQLFRLDLGSAEASAAETEGTPEFRFARIDQQDVRAMQLDRRQERVLIATTAAIEVRDYATWQLQKSYEHPDPQSVVWLDDSLILVAGGKYLETIDIETDDRSWAGFSRVEAAAVDTTTGNPVIASGGIIREFDGSGWIARAELPEPQESDSHMSDSYRIYLESQPSRVPYRNLIMLRDRYGVATRQLFDPPQQQYVAFPAQEEASDERVFSHGSRIRRREVALVFNGIDGVEGLNHILHNLREYDVSATFFLNGEFITRNPHAAREVADAGHEVGNLFHTYFDMTDTRFRITADFIQQGLAKNEDDYFRTVGDELSMMWHAPFYYVSSRLLDAAEELNYRYIGRDVDALDWVTKGEQDSIPGMYYSAPELVERIMSRKKPGSIIAMRIGIPGEDRQFSGREDYLFQYLDVLINALLEQGYSIVPVSELRNRAQ